MYWTTRLFSGDYNNMRTRFIIVVAVTAFTLSTMQPRSAANDADMMNMIADTAIVRPGCLVATAIGSAFFVISLPIAAMTTSVKPAAHALVVKPARATFVRPLGDLDSLKG